jgi:hypothetical protein
VSAERKLSDDDVQPIRALASESVPAVEPAARFGVSRRDVDRIVKGD